MRLKELVSRKAGLRLIIDHDEGATYDHCNIVNFISTDSISSNQCDCCNSSKYIDEKEWVIEIMGEEFNDKIQEHIENKTFEMDMLIEPLQEELKAVVFPFGKGEHSNVWYYLGTHKCWDSGPIGFAYITFKQLEKEWPDKFSNITEITAKVYGFVEGYIQQAMNDYENYCNGNALQYSFNDAFNHEFIDGCSNFIGYDEQEVLNIAKEDGHYKNTDDWEEIR